MYSFNNKHEITSQRYTENYTNLIHNKFNILFLRKLSRFNLKNSICDLPLIKYKTLKMNRSLLCDVMINIVKTLMAFIKQSQAY